MTKRNYIEISLNVIRQLGLILSFIIMIQLNSVHATHLVGGQLTYKKLSKNLYEITLVVRRDCINGADTVPFDDPALIGVFYGNGDNKKAIRVGVDGVIRLYRTNDDTLHESITTYCVGKFREVCVHQSIYRDTITLPFDERGYILAYQRCCRNITLTNIIDPLETGATYTATITSNNLSEGNSNPQFGPFPPIYACANMPFNFNHAAMDPDGDSLVYTLCTPFKGRTRLDPAGRPENPPYDTISWKSPFNINNIIGNQLKIDPVTGLITAIPPVLGQFLVGVCVYEYRKGQLIGYARRDFELNIIPCAIKPTALFERASPICDGLNVTFKNNSTNGATYQWFFDWIKDKTVRSTDQNPSFKYPKIGEYEVVLVVKNGDCEDTARLTIKVIDPQLKPDFNFTVNCKNKINIQCQDSSSASGNIVSLDWILTSPKDTLNSFEKDPTFNLNGDGLITIKLTIKDENGCTASIIKSVTAKLIDVDLIGNETTICFGDSAKLVKNPNSFFDYKWSPVNTLDLRIPSDPIAKPKVTTTYTVTITDGPCSTIKQITVNVKSKVKVEIIGDSISCNGKTDLIAKSDSTSFFEWSTNQNFNPIIFTGEHLVTNVLGRTTYYVRAGRSDQCKDSASFTVTNRSVKLLYEKEKSICLGDTFILNIQNLNSTDILSVLWTANPIILSPLNTLSPVIFCSGPGKFILYFEVKNQYGCDFKDSIIIHSILAQNPEFEIENECGSLEVKVIAKTNNKVHWDFGDGKGSATSNPATYKYEKPGKYRITLESDSFCIRSSSKEITVVELVSKLKDSIVSCNGAAVELNPGANPNYKYEWTPATGLNNPSLPNPTATVTTSTKYFVTISDSNFKDGCKLMDSICVVVPPKIIISKSPDTTLCDSTMIILSAHANLPNIKIQWCDENNKPVGDGNEIKITPVKSTYYTIKAIDVYDCEVRDTIHVNFYEFTGEIAGNDVICKGNQTKLIVSSRPDSFYTYEWTPVNFIIGSHTDSIVMVNPLETTTFFVKITNGKGCSWERSFTVNVSDPQKNFTVDADPKKIVPGQKSQLTATFDATWKYIWKPNDGSLSDSSIFNPLASPNKTTSYTVTATDLNGCTATGVVTIVVTTCEEAIFLPNAFSPNNDSKNDILFLRARPNTVTKMELIIYSRWGERVFSTTDINTGWDGRYKGKELPPDVFGYGLKYRCFEDKDFIKKGNISLLK